MYTRCMHCYICGYKLNRRRRHSSTDQTNQNKTKPNRIKQRNRIRSAADYISSRDAQLSRCMRRWNRLLARLLFKLKPGLP